MRINCDFKLKWYPAAVAVLNRLKRLSCLNRRQAASFQLLLGQEDPVTVYKALNEVMVKQGWPVGWNKVLRAGSIYGWYGRIVTVQPLRAVTMEIEHDSLRWDSYRKYMNSIWFKDASAVSEDDSDAYGRQLSIYGITVSESSLDEIGISVLRRLNLDRRELPFVERGSWSGRNGLIVLSDGGRFQLTRELVWARGVESCLGSDGRLGSGLLSLLRSVGSDRVEIEFIENSFPKEAERLLTVLKLYRFAKVEIDRIKLFSAAGDFPKLAANIWS